MPALAARPLAGLPELHAGDDLAGLIAAALPAGAPPPAGALLAVAHTAVSKVEGAVVALDDVSPGERAVELGRALDKDPRAVQVALDESAEVLRAERGVLICRTRHGLVCANAGVDVSNVAAGTVVVLPRDPDDSARRLRAGLRERLGTAPAVLISDSFGRPWRNGQVDVAIGLAGLQPLDDWRGRSDAGGTELKATWLAVADAAAAAADLARRKDSRQPVVLVEGLAEYVSDADGPGARALLRPPQEDLFR
jgi:coenzyme F420-0:L-glutamate ligase/coenzyme F420-1:gamma-L-glutamate ligase